MIEITSPIFFPLPCDSEEGTDLSSLFPQQRPLALEIGCGIGDFIVQLARLRPELNFLAIDIYNKGCHKTCKKVELSGLSNVRVLRAEARYLLTHYLPPESLAAIYINCPDPWPKKRHRDRRLVRREFLQTALYYLRPGGDFYFSTDFQDYAEDVAALLPELAGYANVLDRPLVTELPGYPLSKYMRRFLQQGQPIHFVHYRRDPHLPPESVAPPTIDTGFRLNWRHLEHV
jgi:tRNA (guanine-N7-)-methyltransferase